MKMVWEGPVNAQVHSILVTVAGALFAGAIWGLPLRGLQSRVCYPGPIPHPSQEQSSWEAPGQLQPQALGTSLGPAKAGPGHGPSSVAPMGGQGRVVGRWSTALLWHHWDRAWWSLRTDLGSWAMGRMRGAMVVGGAGPGQSGLEVSSRPETMLGDLLEHTFLAHYSQKKKQFLCSQTSL